MVDIPPASSSTPLDDVPFAIEALRSVSDGVIVHALDGRIAWANVAACRLLRTTNDNLVGAIVDDSQWNVIRPDGSPFAVEDLPRRRVLQTHEPQHDVVMGAIVGDGSRRWFSVHATLARYEGEVVAMTVFTDVSAEFEHAGELRSVMDEIQAVSRQREWPNDDRIEFAAKYRSVGPSRRVGGDFYGAYRVAPDRVGFFLGDVCGHGVKAVGLSTLARNTLQAVGPLLTDPNQVLARLHDVVGTQRPDSYLTALYGYIEQNDDSSTVRFACGGHPLPILISGGVASYVGGPGAIIGMIPNLERTVYEATMSPGDQLVVYSDGLLSTPTPQLEEHELLGVVPDDMSPSDLVSALLEIASPAVHDVGYDDTAIMAIRVT